AAVRADFSSLSTRERQVILGVACGKLNKQVAAELGVSEVMVKVHRANSMRKMHVMSLAELVRVLDLLGRTLDPADAGFGTANPLLWRNTTSQGGIGAQSRQPDHVQSSGRDPHIQTRTKR